MAVPSIVIGVVGLGAMGLGIAQVYAQAGFTVRATDALVAARETAAERMRSGLLPRVAAGKLDAAAMAATLARLSIVETPLDLAVCDLIIEAIVENLEAKRALFAQLEAVVSASAILATNTSSLSVGRMADGLARAERLIGLHFFNPAPMMRLVELVATPRTDPRCLDLAEAITVKAGKTVVRCADRPGFVVNRCARPFYGEALAMFEEGRTPSDIDAAMLAAGYKLGPFSLIDLIGVDVNLAATEGLAAAMGGHPRYHVFEAQKSQVARGDLGRKSGRGFLYPAMPGWPPKDVSAIVLRIEATLANEAASLLGEGALSMDGIDTAMRLGLNFPRGPFESARRHGLVRIIETLDALEARAPMHLAGRYVVSPKLRELAA